MFGLRSDPVLSWFLVMCKSLLFQLSSSPAHSCRRSAARARPGRVRGTAPRPRPPTLRPRPACLPAGPCTHASRPGGVAGGRWSGLGPHPSPPSREDAWSPGVEGRSAGALAAFPYTQSSPCKQGFGRAAAFSPAPFPTGAFRPFSFFRCFC